MNRRAQVRFLREVNGKEGQNYEGWNQGPEMATHRTLGNGKEANMATSKGLITLVPRQANGEKGSSSGMEKKAYSL